MAQVERKQTVLTILQNLRDLDGLKNLFWEELNYQRQNKPLGVRDWPAPAKKALAGDPVLFASGGEDDAFHVIYCRLDSDTLTRSLERPVVSQLLGEHPYALFVFSNKDRSRWHFLNVKHDAQASKRRYFRRITVAPGEGLRTAAERLQMLDLASIGSELFGIPALTIQSRHDDAFDVEKVTRDFYEEIANWYFWARDHAVFPKDAPLDADGKPSLMLIRLLTRLIFCWFLREKRNPGTGEGLVPACLFDPQWIQGLLKDSSPDSCTYYPALLQNLFFATLNTEMDAPGAEPRRRFIDEGDGKRSDDHMVHQLWRHVRMLRDPEALAGQLRGIPFLNGGLFECLDDRIQQGDSLHTVEVRIDGFSNEPKKQPKLPNFLFFGAEQAVDLSKSYGDDSRKREHVRPVLEILNRYNFTLTENTPFEQDVALDPELLGHVFENLLAAYNPETGSVARKATGSFYTPRVVVDWMVDQALIVYLGRYLSNGAPCPVGAREKPDATERVPPEEKRLERLLSWEDDGHDFKPAEVEKLIDAIDHFKALDPACGSGAFPMGMLQKLVRVLQKLDPRNEGWRRRQEAAAEAIPSSPSRDDALKAIGRAFARDNDDYGRKLFLIENCLYGVDIQPIAVQITKLRFFVSLVVDQAIDPKIENYGILPLPNLETKIVAANTLIGLHRGELLLGSADVKKLERDLQKVRHSYFTARSYRRKRELRAKDKDLCAELSKALSESGECTPFDAKRLAGWNPYDTNTAASFFDPGWMFGLPAQRGDGVFDVVIGNPPYVRQEELKNQVVLGSDGKKRPLKEVLKDQYECFTGTADLYVYFFERSLQLMRVGGALSFITSNKYFRAGYGELLRTYLRYATRPAVMLDFGDAPVFTSIAYPAIVVTEKMRHVDKGQLPSAAGPMGVLHATKLPPEEWQSRVMTWTPGPVISEFPDVFRQESFNLSQRDLTPNGWRMECPVNLRLLEKLRKAGTPLGEYVKGRFYYGIKTGLNEAFVVDRTTRDKLIAEHPSSKEVLKPFLRGRDVKRWRTAFAEQYLIKIESSENKTHPWSDKPEKEAEKIFAKTYPAIHSFFTDDGMRKKLIGRYDQGRFFWELRSCDYWEEFEQPKIIVPAIEDETNYAPDEDAFFSNDKTSVIVPPSVPFALAILNSAVSWWITQQAFASKQGGFYEFKPMYVSQLPIPSVTPAQEKSLEKLVTRILATKKADREADVSVLEREIDQIVYGLYGLTAGEIRVVDPSNSHYGRRPPEGGTPTG
jgi:adenine-specific DNA-methyltransferase